MIQIPYHFIDAIFYFAGFVVPIYFILMSRNQKFGSDLLVKLMIILASFMLIQFSYHVVGMLDLKILSKGILEPLSAVAMTIFAIFYFFSIKKTSREKEEKASK
ncbi:MAG TPA: hypothetical protein VJM74_04485 [Nitrososphaeraceae archaeon]|nr:hypothetical protein [Nitrososphaeraceae archaeon]